MSLKSRETRKALAIASVTALAAFGAATTSAQAVEKQLTYQCDYPLVGIQPLTVNIDASIPGSVETGQQTAKFAIDALAIAGGNTSQGIARLNAASLSGVALSTATVTAPGKAPQVLTVPITIPSQAVASSGDLLLDAAGRTPQLTFSEPGTVNIAINKIALVIALKKADGSAIALANNAGVAESDENVNTFDVVCTLSPASQNITLANISVIAGGGATDRIEPLAPLTVTASGITQSSATLSWDAASDDVGVAGYDIYNGNTKLASTNGELTAAITGLIPNTAYKLNVRTRDAAGNVSPKTNVVFSTPKATSGDVTAPTIPGKPVVSAVGDTGAKITWTKSTDAVGVTGYDVYLGANKVASTTTALTTTLAGLNKATVYSVTVKARDAANNTSAASAATTLTTTGVAGPDTTFIPYPFNLAGTATLKTLITGSLPLSGSIKADLGLPSGKFTAELKLNQAVGNLKALGFLPVVAKVAIVPTAPVTGSLINGILRADAKVRIKLPRVTLFGIELAGGAGCQTKAISGIALKSVDTFFDPLKGGVIAGTFAISELVNCGFLTGIVSPLTSGKGNAIALNLIPVAKA